MDWIQKQKLQQNSAYPWMKIIFVILLPVSLPALPKLPFLSLVFPKLYLSFHPEVLILDEHSIFTRIIIAALHRSLPLLRILPYTTNACIGNNELRKQEFLDSSVLFFSLMATKQNILINGAPRFSSLKRVCQHIGKVISYILFAESHTFLKAEYS